MTKSDTATRFDMDNTPDDHEVENLRILCENVLQPLRDALGPIRVNSGYRNGLVNEAVGGSRKSDHCHGFAADIEIEGMSNYALARYIADNFDFTQLILEFYTPGIPSSGWVHVSYDDLNLKREILTAVRERGRTIYHRGLIE
jgi:hypothetical protein